MKKRNILLMTMLVLSLTGCASVDSKWESLILVKSGILEKESYQKYKSLFDEGKLDSEGYYTDTEIFEPVDSKEEMTGSIHVTFADNRYLTIDYFLDEELTKKIDIKGCHLNPGDNIYISEPKTANAYSNMYQLSEFIIYEYNDAGNQQSQIFQGAPVNNKVYKIPDGYKGKELSVVPIGKYSDRELSMEAYYIDDTGKKNSLNGAGKWSVNGEECDNKAKISPIESYALSYTYDVANYFFVQSDPVCFHVDNMDGTVEFWEAGSTEEDKTYNVELHPYLNLSIVLDKEGTVLLNNGTPEKVKKGKTWSNVELKFGDKIIIETEGECSITDGDYSHINAAKDPLVKGNRYTLTVNKESNLNATKLEEANVSVLEVFDMTFDTKDDHGICSFRRGKEEISGTVQVKEGDKITIYYELTDSDYKYADTSEGIGGWLHDHAWDKNKREETIVITSDMAEKTISRSDYFNIVKKEG